MKQHLRITIETLLEGGASQREIERRTGVDRKTIRRYARLAKSPTLATGSSGPSRQTPPPRPPGSGDGEGAEVREAHLMTSAPDRAAAAGPSGSPPPPSCVSACAEHHEWIAAQVGLGRNAVSIYQDLVETRGFEHAYNSVKRCVAKLRARDPERFDVLEFPPGEEAQVDFGRGAPTLYRPGCYRRPWLFVMTLKYSGKSFRITNWKADQETWARLHEQGFHTFGGCTRYVVLDNLKAGVLRPDIYEPELNPVYAALLAHYGVVADPCRIGDPNRKGTVESAIQHTQGTALKGKRFDSIEAQNAWLAHWEERWAAPRIHGRKKRQVLEMFRQEQPSLQPLPATRFRCFKQGLRTVDDGGLVQVDGSYYAALPAPLHSQVVVRIYDREIEILDTTGQVLRRHEKSACKGTFILESGDRLFNPSRETGRLLSKAERIGPQTAAFAQQLFARLGRPGQRALYGLTNLARTYTRDEIEAVCTRMLAGQCHSYSAVRRALERIRALAAQPTPTRTQADPAIRDIGEYQTFWDTHSHSQEDRTNAHVDPRA
ncbi:MAG: IS21 family transposase [Acidobacteria bacterium]|nr:IS21 family transposase [Acidobacteriota bacterium]